MADHRLTPLLPSAAAAPWPCLHSSQQQREEEELRRALLRASLELESTRAAAKDELLRLEDHALRLACLLDAAVRERDEARAYCHALLLLLEKQQQQHQPPPPPPPPPPPQQQPVRSYAPDEGVSTAAPDSSSEESSTAAPSSATAAAEAELEEAVRRRGLPQRGRLVEAVMAAGPLLQTLLLAGPLPQWQRPPPALKSSEIPPVPVAVEPGRREAAQCLSPSSPDNTWQKMNKPVLNL